jgi:putative DNA primase/helicase
VAAGGRAAAGMIIVPGPRQPFAVAEVYAEVRAMQDRPLRRWRGDWYAYSSVRWVLTDEEDVRAEMVRWLTSEEVVTLDKDSVRRPWRPTRGTEITDVLRMLGDVVHRPSAAEIPRGIFLSNGWIDERQTPRDYSPDVFNTSAANYAWEVKAQCPNTLAWLNDILSAEDVELLRQWLGYLVSKRTDLQKMLVLIGPPRSGKGTLLWLMEELLGPGSTASIVAFHKLIETFGRQPMIGTSMTVMPDVRWSTKDAADAVPMLLSISGEDIQDVDRKNMKAWRGRLDTRFVIASNDTPSLTDASGALAGRMLTIEMDQSFLGKEDPGLKERIRAELPGVLQWALGGLGALSVVGRFVEPAASVAAREEVRQTSNPAYLFVEDMCLLGPFAMVMLDDLYRGYDYWCQKNGYSRLPSSILVRQLKNTFRGKVTSVRRRTVPGGPLRRVVLGMALAAEPAYAEQPLYEI